MSNIKYRKIAFLLFCILTFLIIVNIKSYIYQSSNVNIKDKNHTDSSNSLLRDKESIYSTIEAKEYCIQWQKKEKLYSAPNRKHNLRFNFKTNGFTAQLRTNQISKIIPSPKTNLKEELNLEEKELSPIKLSFELLNYGKKDNFKEFNDAIIRVKDNNLTSENRDLMIESINNSQGMRQNYIVKNKPNGNGELMVNIAVTTNMVTSIKNDVITFELKDSKHTQIFSYSDLNVWDVNNKPLEAHMSLIKTSNGNDKITLIVNDKNAHYPITIDPIIASGTPGNSNATLESNQSSANLGYSVSSAGDVNGDGYSDVIVGAYNYDNGQTNEGAAFIHHGSSSGISTTAAAMVESNQADANFGYSVSTAGDVNGDGYSDVIVGAYNYDNGQADEGAAFVYHGSASGISTTAAAMVQSNQIDANLGGSVALAGDVNNDGYSDVIVGASSFNNGQNNEGVAYVYHGSASGINTTAAAMVQSNQADAFLGETVNSAGDVNRDGYSDVIVGSRYYDNGQTDEGVVFVYHGSSSGISTTAAALLQSNQSDAYFGNSISSAGDVNGDGYSDVIVGDNFYENGQTDEGAVFVYHGSSSGINTTAATFLEGNNTSYHFGTSVSSAGDVNGDGYSDIIVGIDGYDNGQVNEGAAFVYHGSSSGINTNIVSSIESNQANSILGISVSSAGDVNGDGYSDVIVGAYNYDNGQTNEGAAFVYHGSGSGISTIAASIVESNQANAFLGISVSSAGDVNGDGYSDVIVGAYGYDNGQTNEGAAFIYHGSSSGINTTPAATVESNQANTNFGISVSSAGDVNGDGYSDVIVGAEIYDNGQTDEGAAFIYHGSSTGISTTAAATVESNQANANFGISVSSAGDVNGDGYSDVIVGAYFYDNGQSNEGAAFVYHGSSTGIITTAATMVESNQVGVVLGYSVSSAGDVNGDGYSDVVVGIIYYANGQTDEGAAFVYHGSISGINSTPATIVESNQSYATLGISVSSAGDVNGDGFSDVIVGADGYDNGQTGEGAAFVYHGSSSGISTTAAATIESNQANANLGISVSSAGDVNGDGYSDVIVGAYYYDNGQTNEGATFVYHGSETGISTIATATIESNQANANLGISVSSAGDVNGDGFSDAIVGTYNYDNGQTNEGAASIYFGGDGDGLRNNIRLTNADGATLININNVNETSFGVKFFTKNFLGRDSLQMVWELRSEGLPFSSASSRIDRSVSSTGIESNKTNVSNSLLLNEVVDKITGAFYNKIRVRTKYSMAKAITGQMYGPWRYMAAMQEGNMTHNIVPLPIELISFNVKKENCNNMISIIGGDLITLNNNIDIYKSEDGINYKLIHTIFDFEPSVEYSYADNNVKTDCWYKIRMMKNNEIEESEPIFIDENCKNGNSINIIAYPNGTVSNSEINFKLSNVQNCHLKEIIVLDMSGKLIYTSIINEKILTNNIQYQLNLNEFASGNYVVSFVFNHKIENIKILVQ